MLLYAFIQLTGMVIDDLKQLIVRPGQFSLMWTNDHMGQKQILSAVKRWGGFLHYLVIRD